jgi:riboflavin kinase/FMN adenylyltransferase
VGFPTANIDVPAEIAWPVDGIYACWYERAGGSIHPAAVSLGQRPTFWQEDHPRVWQEEGHIETSTFEMEVSFGVPVLEAFLLDFDGDLYGEVARVSFVERLREERRFDSVSDLAVAMADDVDRARTILAETGPGPG